jgi:uncharacterized protein
VARIRLFLDTNVLVSAVLFAGVPGQLLDAVRGGRADGIVSLHVLSEFIEVLARPRFGFDEATSVALAEEIAEFAEVVPLLISSGSWVSDRDDDPVVEAALTARATHIVTGDAHILAAGLKAIAVVTPAEALALIGSDSGE